MKSQAKILALIIATTLLISCSTTTVTTIPQNGNIFTVIAVSSTLKTANLEAARKAQNICVEQNRDLIILDQEAADQGLDSEQQALVGFAKKVLPGSKVAPPYTPSDHNFKVTLDFTCEPK